MINPKTWIFVAAAFLAGSFVASPELRAYASTVANDVICTGCVGTADLASNAVTTAKIKDGDIQTLDIAPSAIGSARIKDNDVKEQDLAPDSVGASEVIGVTKLIFADCTIPTSLSVPDRGTRNVNCVVPGFVPGDRVVATEGGMFFCFDIRYAGAGSAGNVTVVIRNECDGTQNLSGSIGLIVFHT